MDSDTRRFPVYLKREEAERILDILRENQDPITREIKRKIDSVLTLKMK